MEQASWILLVGDPIRARDIIAKYKQRSVDGTLDCFEAEFFKHFVETRPSIHTFFGLVDKKSPEHAAKHCFGPIW